MLQVVGRDSDRVKRSVWLNTLKLQGDETAESLTATRPLTIRAGLGHGSGRGRVEV